METGFFLVKDITEVCLLTRGGQRQYLVGKKRFYRFLVHHQLDILLFCWVNQESDRMEVKIWNLFSNILSFRRCCDVARFVSQVIPFFHSGTADQPPSVWTKMSPKNVIFKKVCKDKSVSWLSFLSKIRTVSVFLKGFSRLKGADSHFHSWLSAEMLPYN